MSFQLIRTLPGDLHFRWFEALKEALYPAEIIKLKGLEGINFAFLKSGYVLLKEDKPVAACCLYLNPELRYEGLQACCIGNLESIDDIHCSNELFRLVTEDAKAEGVEYIIGPMNGSTWDTYRLGISHAQANFFLEPFYPAYYPKLFLAAGFQSIAHYVSHMDESQELREDRLPKLEARFAKQGITFRNIDLENYDTELEKLHAFCMRSFRNNFLFTSISRQAFKEKYGSVKPYIDPHYVIIAEDAQSNILGFIFCLANRYDREKKGMIIKTIAKDPSIRYGGMGSLLGNKLKQRVLENGYDYMIHAFMIQSNNSRTLSEHFSGKAWKEYELYGKRI